MRLFGGAGLGLTLQGAPTNVISLQAGECYYPNSNQNPTVPGQGTGNAGWFMVKLGRYTNVQFKDPVTGIWRGAGDDSNAQRWIYTDGVNIRIANQSGCAVGATVTTAGTGYTSAPAVTASAGSSVWQAVLGPYVSSVTVAYGGSAYVYPPAVIIDAPPAGGIQATATSAISAGAVTTVTVINQGAGYTGVPNVRFVNDIRDTAGSGANGTVVTTGTQTVVGVLCTDHGNPITSGTIPTLTFTGGGGTSAAATVLMNWGITTYAASTPGAGYGTSATVWATAVGPTPPVGAAGYAGPDTGNLLVRQRNANLWIPTGTGGGLTTAGGIIDGGVYLGIPTAVVTAANGIAPTTAAVLALTMGGFTDTALIQAT